MELPKISIIIPVYNAETTIRKCLDSIIAQSLVEWEAILVDDGSPDSSGTICDRYTARDSRFRVIHKENGGVSSARQAGLEAAQGEYVIHADPDDWVEPEMLTDLYAKAKEDIADMVICDFYMDLPDRVVLMHQRLTSLIHSDVLNDMFSNNIHGSCCNKLVKRQSIQQIDAKFPPDVNYCEDISFNVQLLKSNITISYINQAYYHYVQNATSITNKYTKKTFETQKKYIDFLLTMLPEDSMPIKRAKQLVKKMAFRHSILSDKEIETLYPDIIKVDDSISAVSLLYNLAFGGHLRLAKILLWLYNKMH